MLGAVPKRAPRPSTHPPPAPAPALDLRWVLVAVVAVAAVVRLAASWNDLWLDEIWTLNLLGGLHSPLEIVTSLRHDNNHVLSSLFLYVLRPVGWDWLYRMPALVAGIATVAVGAYVATLDGAPASDARPQLRALATGLVLGMSHPLILWGSEARGYALALAFGLGAVAVAVRDGVRPRSPAAPLCWLLLVLAFLSHALALHMMTAMVAWGAVRALRRERPLPAVATLAWWFVVPAVAFGAFYLGFLRGITVGGGAREGIWPPLRRALAVVVGLPLDTPLALSLVVVLGVAAVGCRLLARRGSELWVLFVVGIVVSPIALAVVQPTNLYMERYFLVSGLLWLLLLARVLAWLAAGGGAARVAAAAALAVFGLANGARVATLLEHGRGSYQAALRYMVAHTAGDVTAIASDHDFRNRLVVEYFGPRMSKPVRYRSRADQSPTQWYLFQKSFGDAPPPARIVVPRGSYRLVGTYPTAMLSGLAWFVYERETPGA
jgi:hypothetical protein